MGMVQINTPKMQIIDIYEHMNIFMSPALWESNDNNEFVF